MKTLITLLSLTLLASACADQPTVATVAESPALATLQQMGNASMTLMAEPDGVEFGALAASNPHTTAMLERLRGEGYQFVTQGLAYWADSPNGSIAAVAFHGIRDGELGSVVTFLHPDGEPVSTVSFERDGADGLLLHEMGPNGIQLLPELPGSSPYPGLGGPIAPGLATQAGALAGVMSGQGEPVFYCQFLAQLIDSGAKTADGLCEFNAAFECGVPYMFDKAARDTCWRQSVNHCAIASNKWDTVACQ